MTVGAGIRPVNNERANEASFHPRECRSSQHIAARYRQADRSTTVAPPGGTVTVSARSRDRADHVKRRDKIRSANRRDRSAPSRLSSRAAGVPWSRADLASPARHLVSTAQNHRNEPTSLAWNASCCWHQDRGRAAMRRAHVRRDNIVFGAFAVDDGDLDHVALVHHEHGIDLAVDGSAFADMDHLALGDAGAQGEDRIRHCMRHACHVRGRGRTRTSGDDRMRREQRHAEDGCDQRRP